MHGGLVIASRHCTCAVLAVVQAVIAGKRTHTLYASLTELTAVLIHFPVVFNAVSIPYKHRKASQLPGDQYDVSRYGDIDK